MLKLDQITKKFHIGTPDETTLFNKFCFEVQKGEFVSIVGSNGSGKTTLLNIVCGSLPVEGGKVFFGGKDITRLSEYKRADQIGRVFQDPKKGTCDELTILENMALADNKHTAALDPKSSETVMRITDKLVKEKQVTSLMVTHNLRFALEYGSRLVMMHEGRCVLDVRGEEKQKLEIDALLKVFNEISVECGN